MERAARSLGLQFWRGDPAYPGSIGHAFPFAPFSRGIEQTCEKVMAGTIDGVPITALDLLYVQAVDTGRQHPDGAADYTEPRSMPVRYACAIAAVGGHRPHVVIEPTSMVPDVLVAAERVELEWGEFNTRYRVSSPERGFATALLDVDLMAWLFDLAPRLPLTWRCSVTTFSAAAMASNPSDSRSWYVRWSISRDRSDPARPVSEAQSPRTK